MPGERRIGHDVSGLRSFTGCLRATMDLSCRAWTGPVVQDGQVGHGHSGVCH